MKRYIISLIWIILLFLLITPKTASAVWNGLSTSDQFFTPSNNGKTWTYTIGNDGTVYKGGKSVNIAFYAYWCGTNGAASCDKTNPDYKNVSTYQSFTISAPAIGDSTASANKSIPISSLDYPCGRIQADLGPDPAIPGEIIGGAIYDTGKICPPGLPTNLSASCPTPGTSATLSWAPDTLNLASYYPLRVDYNPASFNYTNSCVSTGDNTGDICNTTYAATSNTFTSIAGGSYHWTVEACNSSGCSGQTAANFVCTPPPAVDGSECTAIHVNGDNPVTSNQNYSATVSMKNPLGNYNTWTTAASYNLGSSNLRDNTVWGRSRVALPSTTTPGNTAKFDFTVTVPSVTTQTSTPFYWEMVKDGTGGNWFGAQCQYNVTVNPPSTIAKIPKVTCTPLTSTINSDASATWTATASGGSGNYSSYAWTVDGSSVSGSTSTYTASYTNTGSTDITKTIAVTVTDSAGNTSVNTNNSCTVTITAPAPTVTLTASSTSITSGGSTTLSWTITGGTPTSCSPTFSGTPAITSGNWTSVPVTSGSRDITLTSSASATKTFNLSCTNSGGTGTATPVNVSVTPPGTPLAPTISGTPTTCITAGSSYTATLSWSGTPLPATDSSCPNGFWVDIDNDNNWGNGYYHKCTTSTSTTAPDGLFGAFNGATGTLTFQPNITYYARYSNGQNSGVAQIGPISACPTASCSLSASPASGTGPFTSTITATYANLASTPNSVSVNCGNSTTATAANCNSTSGSCTASCSYAAVSTNTPYTVTASTGSTTCSSTSITDYAPITSGGGTPSSGGCPWIQTTGGDVHSNTKIDMSCP